MKRLVLLALVVVIVALPACAALKTYQVTGPVLEVSADKIVVENNKERWEIARDAGTKVTGDLKVGSKVTIEYRMTATAVDVKADTAKPAKKK